MILSTTVTLRGPTFPVDFPEGAKRAVLLKRPTRGRGTDETCPICGGAEDKKPNCAKCAGKGMITMATMARINFADTDDEARAAALTLSAWARGLGLRTSTVIRVAEYGGLLNGNIGNAVIIGGMSGEKIHSRGAPRNGESATFWVEKALIVDVTRTGTRLNGAIKVLDVAADLLPRSVTVWKITTSAYSKVGEHTIEVPKDMIDAAIKKSSSISPEAFYIL